MLPFRYVALYQPINSFSINDSGIWYYGEVIMVSEVQRKDISEIPTNKINNELYLKFIIKDWINLKEPIKANGTGLGVHFYTNSHLLLLSSSISELYIRSNTEYRLYYELKRITKEIIINECENQIKGFQFQETTVFIFNNQIIFSLENGRSMKYNLYDFIKKPSVALKEFRRFLDMK